MSAVIIICSQIMADKNYIPGHVHSARLQRFPGYCVSVRKWRSGDTVDSASTLLFSNSQSSRPKLPKLTLTFPN